MSDSVVVNAERVTVDLLDPTTCPKPLQKWYTDEQREQIRKGIKDGSIAVSIKRVKVGKKKSGTGKAEFQPFKFYHAMTAPGMTVLSRGLGRKSTSKPDNYKDLSAKDRAKADEAYRDGACDYFNYGWVLTMTQPIRVALENATASVDKAIEKQVAQAMKTGLFLNEAAAHDFVITQREKIGLQIPSADADSDDDE
jgi:hypothetical protein